MLSDIRFETGPIRSNDYDRLRRTVGWASYQNTEIEEGLRNSLFTIVGYMGENAIAMGRVVGDGKMVFYIQDLIVVPEFQRRGIGTRILEDIINYIDSKSVNNSIIGLMAAVGKEDFYQRYGFIKRPNEIMGSGMNIWVKKDS